MTALSFITIACYLMSAAIQGFNLKYKEIFWPKLIIVVAIVLHGYLLYRWVDMIEGQNLTFFNLLSLVAWLCSLMIVLVTIFRKPIMHLCLLAFPLASISILFANSFPMSHLINTATEPKQLIHILLSIVTFSVLTAAALQAITLAVQEKYLRYKSAHSLLQYLPPLETMEKLLFQMISTGVICLGLVLVTSLFFFHDILWSYFLKKTILTVLALIVFIFLLVGRHYFGWRGKKAIYCTLSGVFLITLTYFGSLILTELLP